MKEYKCLRCEYRFCSENEIPYCPACDCEDIEENIEDNYFIKEKLESHHIHPKFMDNKNGDGRQYFIKKRTHYILHGEIMNWLWEEVKDKEKAIKNIIKKSEKFIGDENDS